MDLLRSCRVDPVCQSPRPRLYGSFAHGTVPPARLYSLASFLSPFRLRRLSFPAHSAADCSVTRFVAPLWVLHSRPPTDRASLAVSLSLMGSLTPGATRRLDQSSCGHLLLFRAVPSANTLVRWVNELRLRLRSTGSTLPHLWPTGSSSRWPSLITARHFSSCPSDSTSQWTPCPPENCKERLQVRLGCFPLSLSCPFRLLHTSSFLWPARHSPRVWIQRSSLERRRDLNPREQ